MNESEETIQNQTGSKPSEKPREIPNLQKQIDKEFCTSKMQSGVPLILGIILFLSFVFLKFQRITWVEITAICVLALVILPFVIAVVYFENKKVPVSDELKNYMASFSSEQFFSARDMEHLLPNQQPGIIELSHPMEYQQDDRYGLLQPHGHKLVYAVLAVFPIVFAVAALFEPFLWFMVAIMGVLMAGVACLYYFANTGEMTVFDFQEKKICYGRCRHFHPGKTGKMKSVSFSEVDHLSLALFKIAHRGARTGTVIVKYIGLLAVKSDGEAIPLCRASKTNLPRLLALLPDLAEKMGHLLITHF